MLRNRKIRSRKGSTVVLLALLFLTMAAAMSMIYEAADRCTVSSLTENACENAGRIVLSCYDKELRDRFGIYAFEMDDVSMEKAIRQLVENSLHGRPSEDCSILEVQIEKSGFQISSPEHLQMQISRMMKKRVVVDHLSEIRNYFQNAGEAVALTESRSTELERLKEEKEAVRSHQNEVLMAAEAAPEFSENGDPGTGEPERENGEEQGAESEEPEGDIAETGNTEDGQLEEEHAEEVLYDFDAVDQIQNHLQSLSEEAVVQEGESPEDRVLRSDRILKSLPSVLNDQNLQTAYAGTGLLSGEEEDTFGSDFTERLLLDEYILDFFSNHMQTGEKPVFFRNEVEYVLYGATSDQTNYQKTIRTIAAIRMALNTACLLSDPSKMELTLSMATALTPPPFDLLTQMLLIAAWSAAETKNDIANLEAGNGVPVLKSAETWMTSLDSVLNGSFREQYLEIPGDSMMKYPYYLRLLLLTEKQRVKICRIMDLIQIDMKGSSRDDFVLEDLFAGFSMRMTVRKKSHSMAVPAGTVTTGMTHTYLSEREAETG